MKKKIHNLHIPHVFIAMILGWASCFWVYADTTTNTPDWRITTGHQYAMVVYATVVDAVGNPMTNAESLLSANEYGTLVGVTPLSNGPKRPLYQLKVSSDNWQSDLNYSFYDAQTDKVFQIGAGPGFESGSTVGSIVEPVTLTLKRQ
jgi:hypothetical protein